MAIPFKFVSVKLGWVEDDEHKVALMGVGF